MLYKDAPMDVPEEHWEKVIHASLTFGGAVVMTADIMPGAEVKTGENVHVMIGASGPVVGERYFNNLANGGKVILPWGDTFWGAKFGQLVDKFGICWMVNCESEKQH